MKQLQRAYTESRRVTYSRSFTSGTAWTNYRQWVRASTTETTTVPSKEINDCNSHLCGRLKLKSLGSFLWADAPGGRGRSCVGCGLLVEARPCFKRYIIGCVIIIRGHSCPVRYLLVPPAWPSSPGLWPADACLSSHLLEKKDKWVTGFFLDIKWRVNCGYFMSYLGRMLFLET